MVLLGVQRLGLPIPLGGTSVFFRRNVLERIGAWDAHNVTEDADLGMRLARFGYRCEMIASTTWEEANSGAALDRQRSRWLKGYAVTWATHMRRPRQLWRDLGPRGFWASRCSSSGAITSYLSLPLFWAIWTGAIGFDLAFWRTFPRRLMWSFFASMIARAGGDADHGGGRGAGCRAAGAPALGAGAALLLAARGGRRLAGHGRALHPPELLAQD